MLKLMLTKSSVLFFMFFGFGVPHCGAETLTSKVKNVILVIGDGMGPQQVGLLLSYARQAPQGILKDRRTALDRMMEQGVMGLSLTYTADSLVTDSAASATQLATGIFSEPEMIGLDKNGNPIDNVIDQIKRMGKVAGLVSDTRITHATPAAFASHQSHRSQEENIPDDLLKADVDVLLSGGLSYWIPEQANETKGVLHQELLRLTDNSFKIESRRKDRKNPLFDARQQGYTLVFNKKQLFGASGKTLGLFAGSAMVDGIVETRNRSDDRHVEPTLKEMSAQALKILESHPNGFFLMIEAGQIDWASHRNDTGLLLHEMLRFNETLNYVLDWAANRQDTLVVVTADHETGGFGFSYSAENVPKPRPLPGSAFADGKPYQTHFNYGNPEILDRLYAQNKSYHEIFHEFDRLKSRQKSPSMLAAIINRNTQFKISEKQAKSILITEDNPYYQKKHLIFGEKKIPQMGGNGAFFVYQKDNRENLLARSVASDQQAVWASGTHTSTPVLTFAAGPQPVVKPFAGILHHTDLGRLIMAALAE